MDMIPVANLHRLDLKPGDRLAVILPDGIVSARDVHEFQQRMQDQLDECAPDLRAIVFPPGTQLQAVWAQQPADPDVAAFPLKSSCPHQPTMEELHAHGGEWMCPECQFTWIYRPLPYQNLIPRSAPPGNPQ